MFVDNGHSHSMLEGIINTYVPPTIGLGSHKSSKSSKRDTNVKSVRTTDPNHIPTNLFDMLPFRDTCISDEDNKPYVVMKYLPDGIYH